MVNGKLRRAHFVFGGVISILTIWSGLVNSFNVKDLNGDIGNFLDASNRILAGQIPHLDFVCPHGPVLYYIDAFFFWILGSSWFASQFTAYTIHPSISIALFLITGALGLRRPRSIFLYFCSSWFLALHWPTLRFWMPLVFLCLIYFSAKHRSIGWQYAAVFLCGASFFIDSLGWIAVSAGVIPLIAAKASRAGNVWWKMTLALIAPLGMCLIFPEFLFSYLSHILGFAGYSNYYAGLPFPGLSFSIDAYMWYGMPLFLFSVIIGTGILLVRRRDARGDIDRLFDLGLAVYGLVLFRYPMYRSDYMHLMCLLPGCLLLFFRISRNIRLHPIVISVALFPFFLTTVKIGLFYSLADFRISPYSGYVEWREQGVWAPVPLVEKARALTACVDERTLQDEPILCLPLPFHAYLAGRQSAIPILFPEQSIVAREPQEALIRRIEEGDVGLFILDHPEIMPRMPEFYAPLMGETPLENLSWASHADEVIFRKLREILEAHYSKVGHIYGADIFIRRKKPKRILKRILAHKIIPSTGELGRLSRGQSVEFPIPRCPYDEIRIAVRCKYFWGLASFAKTNLKLEYRSDDGKVMSGYIQIPPASLGEDIRFRVAGTPDGIRLAIHKWGAMVSSPRKVEIDGIYFMRMEEPLNGGLAVVRQTGN